MVAGSATNARVSISKHEPEGMRQHGLLNLPFALLASAPGEARVATAGGLMMATFFSSTSAALVESKTEWQSQLKMKEETED